MKEYYSTIFKRKSFHLFKNISKISEEELKLIEKQIKSLKPLIEDIKVEFKIVKESETTCKRGCEYCILIYSEKKEGYLQNVGYLGEQLDLFLVSLNIGTLWFGIGKPKDTSNYVIMISIAKVDETSFRKDMFKSKRKELNDIWKGNNYLDIANIVRFAPSACNTQPWIIESNNNEITLYRYKKPNKRGIMPADKVIYYNRIDIGIFMMFLETCLENSNIKFERILYPDNIDAPKVLTATYKLDV